MSFWKYPRIFDLFMKMIDIPRTQDEGRIQTFRKHTTQLQFFLIEFGDHSRNCFLAFLKCIIIITMLEEVR